jgi:hypothetical protein
MQKSLVWLSPRRERKLFASYEYTMKVVEFKNNLSASTMKRIDCPTMTKKSSSKRQLKKINFN